MKNFMEGKKNHLREGGVDDQCRKLFFKQDQK